MHSPLDRLYPEARVGGFTRVDGTVAFYARVNALLESHMTVLDYGAGRGVFLDSEPSWRRDLQNLRGKVARVVGVDVDPAVLGNASLDEAYVVAPGDRLPLEDQSVELVMSDHVFEHVDRPDLVVSEIERVLVPGGWLCARTPNGHGYIAAGARVVPNRLHSTVLRTLQPEREEQDVFPTRYLLNTPRQLSRHLSPDRFEVIAYTHDAEPAYFGRSVVAWRAATALSRLLPSRLGATMMVFAHKR